MGRRTNVVREAFKAMHTKCTDARTGSASGSGSGGAEVLGYGPGVVTGDVVVMIGTGATIAFVAAAAAAAAKYGTAKSVSKIASESALGTS